MKQCLPIENYYDGYKSSELNCIDLPIAGIAGYFDREFYFWYGVIYSICMNCYLDFQSNWIKNHEIMLDMAGLEFISHKVQEENLMECVIQCINADQPVLMIVKYGSLFYSRYYGWGTYNHGMVISDYDLDYNIVGIRDREVVREHIDQRHFTSDVLHRLPIKIDYLKEIWGTSNACFIKESLPYQNRIFSIRKIKTVTINKIGSNLMQYGVKTNQFEEYLIRHVKEGRKFTKPDIEAMRRVFYRSFLLVKDVMIRKMSLENEQISTFEALLDEFLRNRMMLINQLELSDLRGTVDLKKFEVFIEQDNVCFQKVIYWMEQYIGITKD